MEVEVQEMGIDTSLGRRPTVASVTDVPQRSFAVAAEARGRGRSAHERVGRAGPMPRRGPTLSGSPITFPFKPLEPRGLLLSVMRQKVGKERSQGDCHPLGHPPLLPELGQALLRADASGALQSKLQSSGAERHRAPTGVAEARATL
jgi:hypothetical protein